MKKLLNLFFILVAISCIRSNEKRSETDSLEQVHIDSTNKESMSENLLKPSNNPMDKGPIWIYDAMTDSIVRSSFFKSDTFTASELINKINTTYKDKIYLEFVKISHDNIYVAINDSEFLTQRSGSTGAMEYMIISTFTLTELENIDFVNFNFEFGDHASPGTYSREYFKDLMDKTTK